MNKKGQSKLIAAFAVVAMVVCAFAAITPLADVDGSITAAGEDRVVAYGFFNGDNDDVNVNAEDPKDNFGKSTIQAILGESSATIWGDEQMDEETFFVIWETKENNTTVEVSITPSGESEKFFTMSHTQETAGFEILPRSNYDQWADEKIVTGEYSLSVKFGSGEPVVFPLAIDTETVGGIIYFTDDAVVNPESSENGITFTPVNAVASLTIGVETQEFNTLESAWRVAADVSDEENIAEIKLLDNANGNGLALWSKDKSNIILDLNSKTYTVIAGAVGSETTESQALHLEVNNTVMIKNGALTSVADSGVCMFIQNYCTLTLDSVTVNGSNIDDAYYGGERGPTYTLVANYNSNVTLKGSTAIIADMDNDGYPSYAIAAASNTNYDSNITIELGSEGLIDGNISVGGDVGKKTVMCYKSGTIDGEIQLDTNSTLNEIQIYEGVDVEVVIPEGVKASGSVTFGLTSTESEGDGVVIDEITAGDGGIAFSLGSIAIEGNVDESSPGTIKITGEAKVIGKVDLTGVDIVLEDGATLLVPEDAELVADSIRTEEEEATATLIVNGKVKAVDEAEGAIDVNMKVSPEAVVEGNVSDSVDVTYDAADGQFAFRDTLNSDYTVAAEEYLTGDLVIPEGRTLTIASNGSLSLGGYNIYLMGTLAVDYGGKITAVGSPNGDKVFIHKNATFSNEGTIAGNFPITVSAETDGFASKGITVNYTGVGSVALNNVTGIEFALKNITVTDPEYQLTVTGDLQVDDGVGTIALNEVQIVGETIIGNDVTLSITDVTTLMGKAVLTVDGKLITNDKLTMVLNSALVMNGQIEDKVIAETGKFLASETYAESGVKTTTEFNVNCAKFGGDLAYINGFTLSVKSEEVNKIVDTVPTLYTVQSLFIEGDFEFNTEATGDSEFAGTVTIDGLSAIIAEDVIVTLPVGMKIANLVVDGTVIADLGKSSSDAITNVSGTTYQIKVAGSPVNYTQYVTTFENAIAVIADADKQTITVYGNVEIEAGFTILEKQVIKIDSNAIVKISDKADVVVNKSGKIDGSISNIAGSLKVYNGATVTPLPAVTAYAVKSTGTDDIGTYTIYAGLQYALDNAKAGDVIELVNATTIEEGDLVIPEGVTVIAKDTITVEDGDLSIENGAKLIMEDAAGIVMEGDKAAIDVKGDLDMTETSGTITYDDAPADVSFTSTGTTNLGQTAISALVAETTVNGVVMKNDDNETIITNAEAAVAAVAAQDSNKTITFMGEVSAGDIDGVKNIVIEAGAKVVIESLTLADGQILTINEADGTEFTGIVNVMTGVAGSEIESALDLTKVANMTVTAGKDVSTENVTTYEMQMSEKTDATVRGKVIVSAGTAVLDGVAPGAAYDVYFDGKDNSLTVASGATLEVQDNATLKVGDNGATPAGASVVVDGTLDVKKDGTVSVEKIIDIAGTMNIDPEAKPVVVDGTMNVTGSVNVLEKEGKSSEIDVIGTMIVGDKPTALGAGATVTGLIDTNNAETATGYIKVYANADVTGAGIDIDAATGESKTKSTAVYINGVLYMTLYAQACNETFNEIFTNEKFEIAGLDLADIDNVGTTADTMWFTDADLKTPVDDATVSKIGDAEELFFKANPAIVDDIKVSVGTGISLYIDGIKIDPMVYIVGFELPVGTHTVSAIVDPGYKGEPVVTFMGQEVNGTITITADMDAPTFDKSKLVISASGDITTDSQVVVNGGSEDGMSLTDILLIVLVVLILIMAIIVAMRLMRS